MRSSHVLLLAGLTVLSAFLLSAVYAFVLRDFIVWLGLGALEEQAMGERWRTVFTVTCITALALLAPILASQNLLSKRMPEEAEPSDDPLDYQAITQTAQDAIIFADEAGTIISCNRAAEAMFGHDGEEMFGEPLTMLIPQRYREAHTHGLARVSAGGEARMIGHPVELSGLRYDGREFPVELSLSTWSGERWRGYTGIIRDITHRKREQEALRQSEERLRKLVETAPDAVVVVDVDGKIVAWNPSAQSVFGYEEHEAIGADVTALMPERYRKAHAAGMQRLRDSGEARLIGETASLHGLRKDGSEFPLELALGTWSAGNEAFFSAIIRDASKPRPVDDTTAG